METQKIPNNQSNLEKERKAEKSGSVTLEYIVNLWADLSRHFFSTLGQWLNILLSGKISRDNKESDIARGTFLFTGQLNSKTIDSDIDNSYMV